MYKTLIDQLTKFELIQTSMHQRKTRKNNKLMKSLNFKN